MLLYVSSPEQCLHLLMQSVSQYHTISEQRVIFFYLHHRGFPFKFTPFEVVSPLKFTPSFQLSNVLYCSVLSCCFFFMGGGGGGGVGTLLKKKNYTRSVHRNITHIHKDVR